MFDREIHFTVAGREYTDEDLLVFIPCEYADLFEGHNFSTMERLSRALMFAGVASEANRYNRTWVREDSERSLKRVLEG